MQKQGTPPRNKGTSQEAEGHKNKVYTCTQHGVNNTHAPYANKVDEKVVNALKLRTLLRVESFNFNQYIASQPSEKSTYNLSVFLFLEKFFSTVCERARLPSTASGVCVWHSTGSPEAYLDLLKTTGEATEGGVLPWQQTST